MCFENINPKHEQNNTVGIFEPCEYSLSRAILGYFTEDRLIAE